MGPLPTSDARGVKFFAVFWCTLTFAFDFLVFRDLCRQVRASTSFIPTAAVVLSSSVEEIDSDEGSTYRPRVVYEYKVNRTVRSAQRISFGQMSGSWRKSGRSEIAAGSVQAIELEEERTGSGEDANVWHRVWLLDSAGDRIELVRRTGKEDGDAIAEWLRHSSVSRGQRRRQVRRAPR